MEEPGFSECDAGFLFSACVLNRASEVSSFTSDEGDISVNLTEFLWFKFDRTDVPWILLSDGFEPEPSAEFLLILSVGTFARLTFLHINAGLLEKS